MLHSGIVCNFYIAIVRHPHDQSPHHYWALPRRSVNYPSAAELLWLAAVHHLNGLAMWQLGSFLLGFLNGLVLPAVKSGA